MSDEPAKPPEEHRTVSGEFRAVREEGRRNFDWLSIQNIVVLLGLIGTILGGARLLVTSTWAQGKEHADAGIAVLRAEFAAHIKEEAQSRSVTLEQVGELRSEVREGRVQMQQIYLYMKTGVPQPELEKPIPPVTRDGGH